ncbi:MAG: type II methionyl aminopeptidase [Candidatus Marsarchaeota archaeon]|nr:type II methionyl aminopeptidase [Candidatus Marsarchaeota archaeon]
MEEIDIKTTREVGSFSYKALLMARDMVKPGAKLLDVAQKVESFVKDNGFGCAFPINLSVNEEAAHYTPTLSDEKVFGENDIVKVDFGVAKDGILGDCAVTVDLSEENAKLVDASKKALENAIATIRHGVAVKEIGKVIEDTIESMGFSPIRNLGGHLVKVHELHSDIFVPNYYNGDDTVLEEGMTVAIEPFATSGNRDLIVESDVCEIYGFAGEGLVRSPDSRKVLKEISEKYGSEPFAVRWLSNVISDKFKLYLAIRDLLRSGSIQQYPMLVGSGMITQAEAEVLVTKDGCEVLTK